MNLYFRDLLGSYVYSSTKNYTKQISEELYEYINGASIDNKVIHNKVVRKEYLDLIDEGYLPEKYNEIEYAFDDILPDLIKRRINKVIFQVTEDCNFRCSYCVYTNNDGSDRLHSMREMKLDTALSAIDFIKEHSIDSDFINIGFYGGEPLINYNLIKNVILYTEKELFGKEILFSLTTNGTLLDKEKLEFFNNRQVAITLSLDGPKQINDKNRKMLNADISPFEIVKNKIELITKEYKNINELLAINMVIDPRNPYDDYMSIYELIPELHNIKLLASIVDTNHLINKFDYGDTFIEQKEYAEFISRLEEDQKVESRVNEKNVMKETFKSFKDQMDKMINKKISFSPSGPCIPGADKLFVDCEGNFYPCEKVPTKTYDLSFGDIYSGIDLDKVNNMLKISELTKEECSKCWAFNLCSSCLKYSISNNTISREGRLQYCEESKILALNMLLANVAYKKQIKINNVGDL